MKILIYHHWIKQPDFKISKCSICGCIKQVSFPTKYVLRDKLYYRAPKCKSTFLNDKL
jgi:hypothetical protein